MYKELLENKCKRILMGEVVSFPSCAKVNIFLYITGRREDGYHYIHSLFVPISLFDVLSVGILKGDGLRVKCKEKWFDAVNNSLVKAYKVFVENTGFSLGLDIRLIKNIPAGSGLGGASSNAGVVLHILNALMNLKTGKGLSNKNLQALASLVGGDVPFFIYKKPALVEGIGDRLKGVRIKDDIYMCIVCPDIPFYTKEMYMEYDRLNRLTKRRKGDKSLPPFLGYRYIAESVFNVFEIVTRGSKRDMILNIKKALISCGADSAALSGSGSAVFGLFKSEQDACFAFRRLSEDFKNYKTFSVKVLRGEI